MFVSLLPDRYGEKEKSFKRDDGIEGFDEDYLDEKSKKALQQQLKKRTRISIMFKMTVEG